MTEGEYRVGKDFNPSGNSAVDKIKEETAKLIDYLNPLALSHGTGGREAALAMTAYEDAAMWAVKAITKKPR